MANAENKKEPTAKEAFETVRYDIANLLGFMECELTKQHDKMNWGMYHSETLNTRQDKIIWEKYKHLRYTRSKLIETLASLSGTSERQIEDSLESK